ncbi:hypothetical protein ABKN59_011378 [Abortiporus biennis]
MVDWPQKVLTHLRDAGVEELYHSLVKESKTRKWNPYATAHHTPSIPIDIHSSIFEFLDDVGDLFRCSLVCHLWKFYTRKRLYRSIILTDIQRASKLFRVMQDFRYLRLLVHRITLWIDDQHCASLGTNIYYTFLMHGRFLFPRLEEVTLGSLPLLHSSLLNFRASFGWVKRLSIEATYFQSLSDLRRLVENYFPNITHLKLDVTFRSTWVLVRHGPKSQSLSLSRLECLCKDYDVIHKWIVSTNSISTLQSLAIPAEYLHLVSAYQNIKHVETGWEYGPAVREYTEQDPNGILAVDAPLGHEQKVHSQGSSSGIG